MKKLLKEKNLLIKNTMISICIFYLEIMFIIFISRVINIQLLINVLLSSIIISTIFNIAIGYFNIKHQKTLISIFLFILGALFSLQGVFYKIFKVYFSLYNFQLGDQVNSFLSDAIKLIFKNNIYILIFLLPFILFISFDKRINKYIVYNTHKNITVLLVSLLLFVGVFELYVYSTQNKRYSNYDLYNNVNNISLNIQKIGVLNNYTLDLKRVLFGFSSKNIEVITIKNKYSEEEEEEIISYGENKLDLDFSDTGNSNIDVINSYMRSEEATYKNEYTNFFKNYNLIYITAEGFSEVGVSQELTPTLYKLTHSGFVFNNFYTPNNLSTIGGEFQSLTGLYPDYSILKTWRDGTNSFPYGLARIFQNKGYSTYAYHDNSYVFQDRNQYLSSLGFNNFLACYNGLEKRMNCEIWPQSDDDMIEVTVGDYIDSSTPFMTYYMTVSGHLGYNFNDNYISYQNRDLVSNMGKSEEAEAYVATQIELDRALERLINELEKHNKLDNTVIVLMADHYPYGLDDDDINSLSSYYRDEIEINHNALIIWNNQMKDVVVDKPCMSVDVIPTVYNLFGIDYDSRLFTGKDILSNSFGVAVLADRSWITSSGVYNASSNKFTPKEEVDDNYVDNVCNLVNNRLNISRMILENDYYKYLK